MIEKCEKVIVILTKVVSFAVVSTVADLCVEPKSGPKVIKLNFMLNSAEHET